MSRREINIALQMFTFGVRAIIKAIQAGSHPDPKVREVAGKAHLELMEECLTNILDGKFVER